MPKKKSISLLSSNLNGLSVLALFPNNTNSQFFEARTEAEGIFSRTKIYCVHEIKDFRKLFNSKKPNIIILNGFDDSFDTTCEIQKIIKKNKNTILGIADETSNLKLVRDVRRVTSNVEWIDKNIYSTYEEFKKCIVGLCRFYNDSISNKNSIKNEIKAINNFIKNKSNQINISKTISNEITIKLIKLFDFTPIEANHIVIAEMVFDPENTELNYKESVSDKIISDILSECGSWANPICHPKSAKGFIITLANYIGYKISKGASTNSVLKEIHNRPKFLKHISLKIVEDKKFDAIVNQIKFLKKVA